MPILPVERQRAGQVFPANIDQPLQPIGNRAALCAHINLFAADHGVRQDGFLAIENQFDVTGQMPFEDNSFDAVTALDVIEHNEDDMAILADSYRILKPGGHMIITVPAFMWLWSHNDDINAHVRRYTSAELKQKLTQTGYKVSRVTYNNFFVFPMAAALILLRRSSEAEPELASHHLDEEEYQVEMEPASPAVNTVLTGVGKVEAGLIRRINLPFGTSLIAMGQKPKATPTK